MIAALLAAAAVAILPPSEERVVRRVAADYGLTREQTALMRAIRRAENGVPPFHFGVADRRADNFERQARWTANTIRRRYTGDVAAFARRWCPFDAANWTRNVRHFMRRQGVAK